MALCFASVVILSFFTGITIGYILFEFYIVKKNKVSFNFIEGDEVDKFLEEIRRSKDNGAKMLNYGTNHAPKSKTPISGVERFLKKKNNNKSLSARMRENMSIEKEDSAEVIIDTVVIPASGLFSNEADSDSIAVESAGDISYGIGEDEQVNYSMDDEEMMGGDEDLMGGDEYDSDADEFALDYELLKEYYMDEDSSDDDDDFKITEEESAATSEATENIETSTIDEANSAFEKIDNTEKENNCELLVAISEEHAETNNDTFSSNEVANITDEEESIKSTTQVDVSDRTEGNSQSTTNIALPIPEANKNDKIASNVCIPLGGNTTVGQAIGSNVSIPLTMTEKPVEPSEPPKRKRGRPRKNKT